VDKKIFIRIINEEISNFDFLGNDQRQEEEEVMNLLKNEDFQKQFICDTLLRKKDKIKIDVLDNFIRDDAGGAFFSTPNSLNIEINLDVEYKYDQTKEPVKFGLTFDGNKVDINIDSDYDPGRWGATTDDAVAPSGGDWIDYVDWSDITVQLFTSEGDDIEFIAFNRAPEKIKNLFIREYCEDNIERGGDYPIDMKQTDSVQNIPYC